MDPVSKQPHFKYAAVRLHKAGDVLGRVADAAAEAFETTKDKLNL